jgi:hypothetical protein
VSINRRTAIRQLAIISTGAALLPSCFHEHSGEGLSFTHFKVSEEQQQLLETLAATLIPTTDTPGAKEISADRFVWKMLDDCATSTDRSKFFNGLQQFDAAAKASQNTSFIKLDPAGREALLAAIEAKKLADEELVFFYSTTKRLTILAYSSSQYFLTKVQVYELVPGRWHGCSPVKTHDNKAS